MNNIEPVSVRSVKAAALIRALVAFLFLVDAGAHAAWVQIDARSEPSAAPGLVHRHIVLENSNTGGHAELDLALFVSKSGRLRVFDNPDGGNNLAETLAAEKCLAGVNGGYFDPNFAPLGLRIIDGKMAASLARGRLLSGILISSPNTVSIARIRDFSAKLKPSAAVQCGPFLVDGTQPVRGLQATKTARRTFAIVCRDDRAALGFSSDVSLAELADILAKGLGDLKVQRALNLDGGSSSAFWFRRKDGSVFSISEQKPVRDFVGIIPR